MDHFVKQCSLYTDLRITLRRQVDRHLAHLDLFDIVMQSTEMDDALIGKDSARNQIDI